MFHILIAACLLVAFRADAAPAAKKAPAGKPRPAKSVPKGLPAPIDMALAAAPLLSSDPDREAHGRAKIVEALAMRGELKRARTEADAISDYRRGISYGLISIEAARKGESELAADCLEEAAKCKEGQSDWRRERIAASVCIATAEAGRFEEAFEQLKQITEPEDIIRTRAGFARAYARVNKLDQASAEASEVKGGFSITTAPLQAEAFLEIALARERAKDRQGAAQAAHDAVVATDKVSWLKIDTARRAAELLHRLDKKDQAQTILAECRQVALQISDRADFKGRTFASLARSFAACGDREAAVKLLQDGERSAETLELNFRCEPLAQLGAAWAHLGDMKNAERLWVSAAKTASTHRNPRVKGMGYIDVCLAAYETHKPLPESVRGLLSIP